MTPPLIYLIAGEPSGDQLGGRLMAALRHAYGDEVRFAGVGGPEMTGQGLDSLFPMDEIALFGLAEVLPRIPAVLRRVRQTVQDIRDRTPDAVVTIDAPGFCYQVGRRIRDLPCAKVHYVAPTVWAWKPGRAAKLARVVDHLLCLLPFEPPYFEAVGLPATFTGHPILESGADRGDGNAFRQRSGIAPDAPLIAVLPGSRRSEVTALLPVFREAIDRLVAVHSGCRVVVPTVSTVADLVEQAVADWPGAPVITTTPADKYDAFAASDAALAASGTVSLELSMAGTPMVIAYRLNPLTFWLARRLVRVRHVSLVNILEDRAVIPERLQTACRPDILAADLAELLTQGGRAGPQPRAMGAALSRLQARGRQPSRVAAETITAVIANRHGPLPSDPA